MADFAPFVALTYIVVFAEISTKFASVKLSPSVEYEKSTPSVAQSKVTVRLMPLTAVI